MALVECELAHVVLSENYDHQFVVLREKGGEREIPILIGIFEVHAIHRTLHGPAPPRPLTHELFGNVLEQLGVDVRRVLVHDLRDEVYYGRLILGQNGREVEVDSRPSDAIALAVQKGAPVFVEDWLLDRASRDRS